VETFEIKTPGVDVKELIREIEERVEEKKAQGIYDQYHLKNIAQLELENIKDETQYLEWLLKVLDRSWDIHIGDPQIINKGGILGYPVVWLKKIIWQLLKFYTYRLFSQQKEFNSQVVIAVGLLAKRLEKLEQRLKQA